MVPVDGTNENIALGTSNNMSSSVDQLSPPPAVGVGDDRQSIVKTENMINDLIKKRRHLAVSLFESLSSTSTSSPAAALSVPGLSPMKRFNKHHLSVTQLCEQSWCEVKVIYGFLKPHVKRREMKNPAVTAGGSIHRARELDSNPDALNVVVHSREDREGLKLMNLTQMIPALKAGQMVREVPVFGVLEGVWFQGVVDELCRSESGTLVLSELKTRSQNSLPPPAQSKGHTLQVVVYKLLFDEMVQGSIERHNLLQYLNLRPHQAFGSPLQSYAQKLGILAVTFGELVDYFLNILKFSNLQAVDTLRLEYIHQSSGSLIGTREVEFDEVQLQAELRGYLSFWLGEREPQGVDLGNIEESWKCNICTYEETCDWRKSMMQQIMVDDNKRAKFDISNLEGPALETDKSENKTLDGQSQEGPVVDDQSEECPVVDGQTVGGPIGDGTTLEGSNLGGPTMDACLPICNEVQ